MQNAVAVLTRVTGEPWTGHRQSGWGDYISHGAMHAIRQSGLHGVALEPDRLARGGARVLMGDKPRGVIVTEVGAHSAAIVELAADLKQRGVPAVFYGDAPEVAGFDRVTSDHELGGYLLTRWLIEQGRRRILPVWPEPANAYWLSFRWRGYERAMREAGLEPLPHLKVPLAREDVGTYEARLHANAQSWVPYLEPYFSGPTPVDALMLASDGYTVATAEACRLLKCEPNRDVALAGYDNYWQESPEREFEATAPMVTIDKLNPKMGAQLVELLFDRIEDRLPAAPQRRVVAPELIVVGSSQN
jgi:DNA-binding LacI/PurR family transcriptional regulator